MIKRQELLATIKRYLKAKGITYKDLSDKLEISEASVKHMFSKQSFSLERLDHICTVLDIDYYDLARMSRAEHHEEIHMFNSVQESTLVKNPKLLTFFYLIANGWTPDLINQEYDISKEESDQFLLELDKLQLIELHINNRFRVLVPRKVFWRKNGPIWKHFERKLRDEFLDAPFDGPTERLMFLPGKLSEDSLRLICRKIDALIKQFYELSEMDESLPIEARCSTGLAIGFRPWVFTIMSELKKKNQ